MSFERIKDTDTADVALYDKVNGMFNRVYSEEKTNCFTEIPQDIKLELISDALYAWTGSGNPSLGEDTFTRTIYTTSANPVVGNVAYGSTDKQNSSKIVYVSSTTISIEDPYAWYGSYTRDSSKDVGNNTLVLKAGSKVYVPNGSGTFSAVTISSDKTQSSFTTGELTEYYLFYYNGILRYFNKQQISSGSTAPSGGNYLLWYDTTNNIVKTSSDGGSTWSSGLSLPLCRFTATSNTILSIDQVFNGFGYIGSTMFALPGVKGLIPNGRNEDGSLKNIEFTLNKVITGSDYDNGVVNYSMIYHNDETGSLSLVRSAVSGTTYDSATNTIHRADGLFPHAVMISIVYGSSGITSFQPKTTFHALDYNDKSEIIKWGMPTNKADVLTLGASGTTYTAPANGYFAFFAHYSSGSGAIVAMQNTNTDSHILGMEHTWYASNGGARLYCPVKKGDSCTINYNCTMKNIYFRFIYAEGEK